MNIHRLLFPAWLAATFGPPAVYADFGDTADPTFNCPAFTTCKQVCVPTIADCPFEMLCSNGNDTLCPDGTCSESCDGHEESPCAFDCAPVACKKVDDFYDTCAELYGPLWDAEAACGEDETAEEIFMYTFTEPGFILCYVWFSAIPVLILIWCAFNQRLSPVPGSCQKLDLDLEGTSGKKGSQRIAWQTGYKHHPVGVVLHFCTVSTALAIFALLMWLIIQYYVQQEAIFWSWTSMRFEDEVQVLICFIAVWMYGLVFVFSLKFPHSIRSIHLRRCNLAEAGFVAIAVKRLESVQTEITFTHDHMAGLKRFFSSFYGCVHTMMTALFSDRHTFGCEREGDAVFVFRPVRRNRDGAKYITFEFRRYILSTAEEEQDAAETQRYVPGAWMPGKKTIGDILGMDKASGLTASEVSARRQIVGLNRVEMETPSFLRTLKRQFSTPFYTYQIFMVFSWLPVWYYFMAFTWGLVIITGALVISILQHRNDCNLYRLTQVTGEVEVIRDGKKEKISQENLVPGDIVSVEPGIAFCDMALVESSRVLVDESALTGEATPVGKTPLDPLMADKEYNGATSNKRSTIFAGTKILETRDSRAIVMHTASYTARGELIRDIFSYRRQIFKFDTEIPVVVTLLVFYACIGWGLAYHWTGEIFVFGWFYGIYVVAGCLPPLLPTVFTVSVGISDDRLAKRKVTCTNSESILVAGKVTRAFFDKTGTITKQGLDFLSARGKSSWIDGSKDFSEQEMSVTLVSDELKLGMACCHGLVSSSKGEMVGNYVDQVMFTNSQAQFDDSGNGGALKITDATGRRVTLVKRFDFDHHRMTQSVIVRDDADGTLTVFCKGSGEAIKRLCLAETLPGNFDATLKASGRSGIYQISMASKVLEKHTDVSKITRDDAESDLRFDGVINFKNVMRSNAPAVISELEDGEVVSTIVTGDNVLTAICIGKESGIIKAGKKVLVGDLEGDEVVWRTEEDVPTPLPPLEAMAKVQLTVTGAAWQHILVSDPKQAAILQDYVRVFGRCTPYNKIAVIQGFVQAGFITLMCGDGGNDCGALKSAHVGVALSEAEASIVAPFTSLEKDISSVIEVIREGRCALGSALASYKFVIMYGQILTINQLIAAYFNITFTEMGWVFVDGVWNISLSFALPLAQAAKKLAPTRPTASILGLQTMSSAIGVLVINFIFVVIAFVALNQQEWYQCRKWQSNDVSNVLVIGDNFETQVLWLVTGYQIINSATVFNFGYEFRQAWICNWVLVLLVAGYTTIHIYITLVPGELSCFFRINCLNENTFDGIFGAMPIQNDFNTTIMPVSFRRIIVIIVAANSLSSILWDYFVVNGARKHFAAKKRQQKAMVGRLGGSEKGEEIVDEEAPSGDLKNGVQEELSLEEEEVAVIRDDDEVSPPPLS